jgi:hypothetical protein
MGKTTPYASIVVASFNEIYKSFKKNTNFPHHPLSLVLWG